MHATPKRPDKANRQARSASSANQHKPAKRTRNRVPSPQRERILQKYVSGKSIVDISKEEQRNRETISKIVHGPEIKAYVQEQREVLFGLIPDAISAVRYSLTEEHDGRLGFQLLASIGVVPSREEKQSLMAEAESSEEERVNKIIGDLIKLSVERAGVFGYRFVELEEQLEKVGGRIDYEKRKIVPVESKTAP